MSLKAEQSRACRGWLDWTQANLADRAHVGLSTLRDFEAGKRIPIANNIEAIRQALAAGGAESLLSATDALRAVSEPHNPSAIPTGAERAKRGKPAKRPRQKRANF